MTTIAMCPPRLAALTLLVIASTMLQASAATYTWTTSGSGSVLTDGVGTWNTSALNWTTTGEGAAVAWPNSAADVAVFGVGSGAAGTVTVESVSTKSITFNQPGSGSYLLSGGSITLGSSPAITTASGVAAEIASGLTGSGLSTTGGGTLTLSGSSTLSGTPLFTQGEVVLASGAELSGLAAFTVGSGSGSATLRVQSGASLTTTTTANVIGTSSNSRTQGAVIQEGGLVRLGGNSGSLVLSTNGGTGTYTGSASYQLQGGTLELTSTNAGFLIVGRNASATFTQTGGTVTLARTNDAFFVGDYAPGSYAISAGSLTAASTSANAGLGNRGGAGTLTVSGSGSVGLGGSMFLAANAANSASDKGSATIDLQGGTLAVNGMTRGRAGTTGGNGPGTAAFNFSGGTLRPYSADASIGSAISANNFAIALSGTGATLSGVDLADATARTLDVYATLEGTGDVTVSGGLVNLRGTNTFSGLTAITAGGTAALLGAAASSSGFRVNGTLDLSSQTSGFTFGSGQTVSGSGTIALPASGPGVALAGFLAPGNSPGTLAFTGGGIFDLTQAIDTDSSRLLFELGPIETSDLVTVASGTLAIGLGLLEFSDFAFTAIDGFGRGTYTLFSANEITGSLGAATSGAVGSYTGTLELSGNEIQLVVVPEPGGAIPLAGLGVVAAGWALCRRHRVVRAR